MQGLCVFHVVMLHSTLMAALQADAPLKFEVQIGTQRVRNYDDDKRRESARAAEKPFDDLCVLSELSLNVVISNLKPALTKTSWLFVLSAVFMPTRTQLKNCCSVPHPARWPRLKKSDIRDAVLRRRRGLSRSSLQMPSLAPKSSTGSGYSKGMRAISPRRNGRYSQNGCPELIVHFGDEVLRRIPTAASSVGVRLFAGQLTGPSCSSPTDGSRVSGFDSGPTERLPFWPRLGDAGRIDDGRGFARALVGAVARRGPNPASTPELAVALGQAAIRTHASVDRIDSRVQRVADGIIRTGGLASISRLTRATELSPRQVQRRFLDAIGGPPCNSPGSFGSPTPCAASTR